MIHILTSTKTLLRVEVRPQESSTSDSVAEGLLSLKLKQQLLTDAFNEQQGYLSTASIASYVSLNKLDQRQRYRASVNLISAKSEEFNFTKGSSSSGLGYALALFESWWSSVLNKPGKFDHPIFATGEVLTSGGIRPIGHMASKVDAVCTYVEESAATISAFYLCYPEQNDLDITTEQRDRLISLGGILLPVNSLQVLLGKLLGENYDGDPLGRWEPFKGLKSFEYEDSVRFFGRDKDVQRLSDDLDQNRGLLIVSGASGTGKSSLIKAGLIPRLEQENEDLYWCTTTPSQLIGGENVWTFLIEQLSIAFQFSFPYPNKGKGFLDDKSTSWIVDYLSPHIKGRSKTFLLYVDQYEEIFSAKTLGGYDHSIYLELLNEISNSFEQIKIVIALRNEYLGKLLESHALRSPIISNISSQLSLESWELIVFEQAQFSGITFETNSDGEKLDSLIIEQAAKTQHSLPMVSFLLEQLYLKEKQNDRNPGQLSFQSYKEMDGLSGVIAHRAESIVDTHTISKDLIDYLFESL